MKFSQLKFDSRTKRIALTSLTSLILKGLSIGIPIITLKLTYSYLNVEIYGLWNVIITFFALFTFADLGLGNGMQTKLSQAFGKNDLNLCRNIISNSYIILIFISIALLIIFLLFSIIINWKSFFNIKTIESEALVMPILYLIVIPKILSIPISVIQRTQLALQEGYKSDIWNIIGYIVNLFSIYIIVNFNLGKITLISFYSIFPLLISFLNLIYYFNFQRKELNISFKLFNFSYGISLIKLGFLFCILSVLTTIGLSMDTFIVGKMGEMEDAASFSILVKITTICSSLITVISMPLWGANGEAYSKKDYLWIKKNTIKMSILMGVFSIFSSILIVITSRYIFDIWLGENFVFSYQNLVFLLLGQVFLSFVSPFFMFLNSIGELKIQILLFSIFTPLSLILKVLLSEKFGINIIPLIGSLLYGSIIVTVIISYSIIKMNKLLKYNYL